MSWTADTSGNGKFKIVNGKIKTCSGTNAPLVFVRTRLATELGEWIYNQDVGLDYYGQNGFFSSKMPDDEISALVRKEVLSVSGVKRINSFVQTRTGRVRPIDINITVESDGVQSAETVNFTGEL